LSVKICYDNSVSLLSHFQDKNLKNSYHDKYEVLSNTLILILMYQILLESFVAVIS